MSAPPKHLQDLLASHGQLHILDNRADLTEDQRAHLVEQASSIDFALLQKSLKLSLAEEQRLLSPDPHTKLVPVSNVATRSDRNKQEEAGWRTLGLDLIREGKVGAILLAGGQGTRLGSSAPKGCYDIGLPSHKSLFQLQAERILRLQTLAASTSAPSKPLRWYIMTSPATDSDTRAFFTTHSYFGLSPDQVFFFQQGVLPAVTAEGRVIMSDVPGQIAMAPDGNGGIYRALDISGALADMQRNGVLCVDCVSVDNALVRPADPTFVGYCWAQGAEVGARVCERRGPEEKVGVFVAAEGGGLAVREYSELGATEASVVETGTQKLKFRWANLCMQYMTVAFLQETARRAGEIGSTYHVAWKSIPSLQGPVRGVKLEQFIFDPFPMATRGALFEVDREEEFAPVKNAPGAKDDSPDTARRLLLALHCKWARAAGVELGEDVEGVEISPLVSYGGESLDSAGAAAAISIVRRS